MKFGNLEQLVKYIVTENVDLENTDVSFQPVEINPHADDVKMESVDVQVKSLTDVPSVKADIGPENILFVESYEAIKNFCGTGKVSLFGKEIVTNLCEMDDSAHITLSIDFQDKINYNVDFKLCLLSEKADDQALIQLEETLLHGTKD